MPTRRDSKLLKQLGELDRGPFRLVLEAALRNEPDHEAMADLALAPIKWIRFVEKAAKLAGYSDKIELGGKIEVGDMSDADLQAELEAKLLEAAKTSQAVNAGKTEYMQ